MKYVKEYECWLRRERRMSGCTVKAYVGDVRSFFAFLRAYNSDYSVTLPFQQRDVRAWVVEMHRCGRARASIQRAVASIRSFAQFVRCTCGESTQGDVDVRVVHTHKALPNTLTVAQVQGMLGIPGSRWTHVRNLALLAFLYGTGTRISEALSLSWGDLERGDVLCIRGKGQKERFIALLPFVQEYITHWRAVSPQGALSAPVFIGDYGRVMQAAVALRILKKMAQHAGTDVYITPHVLRHSFATHLMESGGDVRLIQESLGHASVVSTQRYMHVGMPHIRSVYESMHPCAKEKMNYANR